MELAPGVEAIGLTLYLKKEKMLVIEDVHIGYEEALNKQGILLPRTHLKELFEHLDLVFARARPQTIILLGDLKHEFGTISGQEWRDVMRFLDYLLSKAKSVVLLKGNHDKIVGPLAMKKGLEAKDWFVAGSTFFCHGDRIFDALPEFKKAKSVIIGHEHPAIGIREGARSERYKCFLAGKYLRKRLIVVPSINQLTVGTDVLQEKLLSPFIKNIDSFSAVAVSDRAYDFGPIKKLRKMMVGR